MPVVHKYHVTPNLVNQALQDPQTHPNPHRDLLRPLSAQATTLRRQFKDRRQAGIDHRLNHCAFEDDNNLHSIHRAIEEMSFPPTRTTLLRCWNDHILSSSEDVTLTIPGNVGGRVAPASLYGTDLSLLSGIPINHARNGDIYSIYYCFILAGFNMVQEANRQLSPELNYVKADYLMPCFPFHHYVPNNNCASLSSARCGGSSKNVLTITYRTFLTLIHFLIRRDYPSFWHTICIDISDRIHASRYNRNNSLNSVLRSRRMRMSEDDEENMVRNSQLIVDYLDKEDHGMFISKNELINLIASNQIPKEILEIILETLQKNTVAPATNIELNKYRNVEYNMSQIF